METIKNYLETMFRNLPDTDQVRKAKSELLQMMEDKFSELRNNGISENEAVGTVISEFGNLEELAEDLGLETVLNENKDSINKRSIAFDEIKNYIEEKQSSIILRAISVACFILCVTPLIIQDIFWDKYVIGLSLMFALIGAGIVLSILSSNKMDEWKYITDEPCSISQDSINYIAEGKRNFKKKYNVLHAIGVLLCVLCFIPAVIFDDLGIKVLEDLSPVFLFVFIATGVALLIYSGKKHKMYEMLMSINSEKTIGGSYSKAASKKDSEVTYNNKVVKAIMDVYWLTITCIYLAWSFSTFSWGFTWIIWPIAGVIHSMIKGIYGEEK